MQVLGFGSGLLPASVVIAARNPSDLFLLSREIVSITFRMAFQGKCRMQRVEAGPLEGTWARTYIGLTAKEAQRILDDFHQIHNVPIMRKIAIGVVSKTWVTLCGPPSSLARLQAWSMDLEKIPCMNTDSGGPVHSRYQPPVDVEKILRDSSVRDLMLDWPKARLLSPSACEEYKHATFGELLADIVNDIMHKVLRVSDVIDASVERLGTEKSVELGVIGPTSHQAAVEQVLKSRNVPFYAGLSYMHAERPQSTAKMRGGSDLVAVVGISGRFPGFPTPSVQRVESETIDESGKQVKVIFSSDLNNLELLQAIEGHVVNEHKICPIGVYTDMALTAAGYAHFALHRHTYSGAVPTIRDFVMSHALALVPGESKPTLFVKSTYSAVEKVVGIVFHSCIDQKEITHGSCQVHFEDYSETWRISQTQTLFLLQARIEALREQAASGKAHRIPKPIVYRLFSSVVNNGERHHALEEVILDAGKSFKIFPPRIFLVVSVILPEASFQKSSLAIQRLPGDGKADTISFNRVPRRNWHRQVTFD